jgi:hypothetical protein
MHCPLSQCCHSFLFSPSERTKWRSKKDPQILELEGLRGLRVLGNKTSKTKVLQLPAAGVWHGSVKTA